MPRCMSCDGRRGEVQRLGPEREGRETEGRQRGDRGEMCDRLTSCTILNNSWTGTLERPNPYSPQENSLFVFVEQAREACS